VKTKFEPCPGSAKRPKERERNVGLCVACGVRTFLNDGLIQPHKSSRGEIRAYRGGYVGTVSGT